MSEPVSAAIEKRLRAVVPYQGRSNIAFLCHEAADTIEALQRELAAERERADEFRNMMIDWRSQAQINREQADDYRARATEAASKLADARKALDDLQQAEAEYRLMHDRHGDGSQAAGRAWDLMRRAGDKARELLNALTAPRQDEQKEDGT